MTGEKNMKSPPPLSAHQKIMTPPHILPPLPPVKIMNGSLNQKYPRILLFSLYRAIQKGNQGVMQNCVR